MSDAGASIDRDAHFARIALRSLVSHPRTVGSGVDASMQDLVANAPNALLAKLRRLLK